MATSGARDADATWAVAWTTSTGPVARSTVRVAEPLPGVVEGEPRQRAAGAPGRAGRHASGARLAVPGAHPDLLDVAAGRDGVDGVERRRAPCHRAPGASTARG